MVAGLDRPLIIGAIGANMRSSEKDKELRLLRNSLQLFDEWGIHYVVSTWSPDDWLSHSLMQTGAFPAPANEAGEILRNALKQTRGLAE